MCIYIYIYVCVLYSYKKEHTMYMCLASAHTHTHICIYIYAYIYIQTLPTLDNLKHGKCIPGMICCIYIHISIYMSTCAYMASICIMYDIRVCVIILWMYFIVFLSLSLSLHRRPFHISTDDIIEMYALCIHVQIYSDIIFACRDALYCTYKYNKTSSISNLLPLYSKHLIAN